MATFLNTCPCHPGKVKKIFAPSEVRGSTHKSDKGKEERSRPPTTRERDSLPWWVRVWRSTSTRTRHMSVSAQCASQGPQAGQGPRAGQASSGLSRLGNKASQAREAECTVIHERRSIVRMCVLCAHSMRTCTSTLASRVRSLCRAAAHVGTLPLSIVLDTIFQWNPFPPPL